MCSVVSKQVIAAVNLGTEEMNAVDSLSNVAYAVADCSTTGGSVGVRLAYGKQKSVQTQCAGKDATLSITGSDVAGLGGTHLKAEGDINIEAADENHLERSKNQSSGFNVGWRFNLGTGYRQALPLAAMWQKAMAMAKAKHG
ncbi:hypothetical protein HMPREF1052_2218 [Pasteurella bettyae CCUG 2042]|uniref:Uncharacterized protein n=1 Tax=Pasteurella bettyae CCUG 2042 TaxID=1095749 RepID=I3D743_9PAST|nr:hypothetical protein HMPREF1052_2218 [Pasteurella bettyae CCUG 2042]SUB21013.1 Uncharacterised protein [Pasteurella bettyae]